MPKLLSLLPAVIASALTCLLTQGMQHNIFLNGKNTIHTVWMMQGVHCSLVQKFKIHIRWVSGSKGIVSCHVCLLTESPWYLTFF